MVLCSALLVGHVPVWLCCETPGFVLTTEVNRRKPWDIKSFRCTDDTVLPPGVNYNHFPLDTHIHKPSTYEHMYTHMHPHTHTHTCPLSHYVKRLCVICYVTGINQPASQSVSELCLSYISWKDDLPCISFQLISLDLQIASLVAVALVLYLGRLLRFYKLCVNPESDGLFYSQRQWDWFVSLCGFCEGFLCLLRWLLLFKHTAVFYFGCLIRVIMNIHIL